MSYFRDQDHDIKWKQENEMTEEQFEQLNSEFEEYISQGRNSSRFASNAYRYRIRLYPHKEYQDGYEKCFVAKHMKDLMCNYGIIKKERVWMQGDTIFFQKSHPYYIKLTIKQAYQEIKRIQELNQNPIVTSVRDSLKKSK